MRKGLGRRNPWLETVRSLHGSENKGELISVGHSAIRQVSPASRRRLQKELPEDTPPLSSFRVLECPSAVSVIVSWSDSKLGHCGYQRWSLCKAVMPGRCSLTGRFISRGDMVFMPASRSRSPATQGAMLLALNIGPELAIVNY